MRLVLIPAVYFTGLKSYFTWAHTGPVSISFILSIRLVCSEAQSNALNSSVGAT